jgi:transcriptional regulator GlxA family with amidase domain
MSFHAAPSAAAAAMPAQAHAELNAEVRRLGLLAPRPALDDRAMPAPKPARARSGLVAWRLKRVLSFMEEHYWEPVTLTEMARVAGLSRMHFAAQFRISTGAKPHEYLLRLRVERAQKLMMESDEPLAQVAFSVGFQTQAHFTTVFRRFAATTPHRWRSEQIARTPRGGAAAPRALGSAHQA